MKDARVFTGVQALALALEKRWDVDIVTFHIVTAFIIAIALKGFGTAAKTSLVQPFDLSTGGIFDGDRA